MVSMTSRMMILVDLEKAMVVAVVCRLWCRRWRRMNSSVWCRPRGDYMGRILRVSERAACKIRRPGREKDGCLADFAIE